MNTFLTIGADASAEGIAALKALFAHMPPDTGTAFIVVQRPAQSPEYRLADLLQQVSKMPVLQVTEKVRMEPNKVYVIPPGKHLSLEDGFTIGATHQHISDPSAALQQSEARLKLAANVANFGIHDFDVRTGRVYWSPELKAMQGISTEKDLSFEEILAAIHPDDRARVEREMRGAMATDGNGEFEQEFRIVRQDNGEIVWMYNRSRTLFEGEGADRHPVRNTGIALNITERKKAEEALHTANTSITEILESIGDVFYALDADFRYTYVNKRAEEAWGKRAEVVLGKTVWEVFPQFSGSESEAMHRRTMESRAVLHYETRSAILHRWISVGIFPAANGGLSVFFQDIEARKAAEEALRQSEERLRITTESAIDYAIINMNAARIIQGWSRGAERILGWTEEEAIGQPADIIFTPEDRAAGAPQAEMETARDTGMSPDER
jgi:PAS domain S-box-containing protein